MKYIVPNMALPGWPHKQRRSCGRSSIGHLFHYWLTAWGLSQELGLEMLHEPIESDSFHYEDFLNLGSQFKQTKDIGAEIIQLPRLEFCHFRDEPQETKEKNVALLKEIIDNGPDNTIFRTNFDNFPGLLSKHGLSLIPKIQEAYWTKNKGRKNISGEQGPTIAVHIRRGDITESFPDRWYTIQQYDELFKRLSERFSGYKFIIVSEGSIEDFAPLHKYDPVYLLNEDDFDSFHCMVDSEVLVVGLSTWSVIAALICKNSVVYPTLHNFTNWQSFGERFIHFSEV